MLDVESVRAFLAIGDHQSFTKAARQLATTQGALSVRLRRLEERLGVRLIERTPRMVRLSAKGLDFVPAAREFLAAHERAVSQLMSVPSRFAVGVAHPLVGADFPALLGRIRAVRPMLTLEAQIDTSPSLIEQLDKGRLDGVIVCSHASRREGEPVGQEPVSWFAARTFQHSPGEPVPLAVLGRTCNIRDACLKSLDSARIPWRETFVGGGSLAVAAAVTAGLGVAALPRRVAPANALDVSKRFELPPQPSVQVMLHSRVSDKLSRETLRTIITFVRSEWHI